MKEAAGEANMTVITIVLIAVVLGVGLILVPNLMKKTSDSACCTSSGGVWDGSRKNCYKPSSCTNPDEVSSCTTTMSYSCNNSATD